METPSITSLNGRCGANFTVGQQNPRVVASAQTPVAAAFMERRAPGGLRLKRLAGSVLRP